MRQFVTIAHNTFMELVRQPVFLLLLTVSTVFEVFLACVNYFGLGDDPKLVKNSVLAVMLLAGLFGAVVSASAAVAREIRTGTALAVLAKPIGRARFLLAKYVGLAAALTLLVYTNTIAALLASRMAFDAYGDVDVFSLSLFSGAVVLAYSLGGFVNYFLRRNFSANTAIAIAVLTTVAFIIVANVGPRFSRVQEVWSVDWRMIPASILILFALWIVAAVAVAASTRLEMVPTLAICSALFLIGLMSNYFYWKAGGTPEGGPFWATFLYTLVPNWQNFWVGDLLESGKQFPWSYLAKAFVYVIGYAGAALALGLVLFEDRELT